MKPIRTYLPEFRKFVDGNGPFLAVMWVLFVLAAVGNRLAPPEVQRTDAFGLLCMVIMAYFIWWQSLRRGFVGSMEWIVEVYFSVFFAALQLAFRIMALPFQWIGRMINPWWERFPPHVRYRSLSPDVRFLLWLPVLLSYYPAAYLFLKPAMTLDYSITPGTPQSDWAELIFYGGLFLGLYVAGRLIDMILRLLDVNIRFIISWQR